MKIALLFPDNFTPWHFYKGLLKNLIDKGVDVYIISTDGKYVSFLEELGVKHIPIDIYRYLSPLKDLNLFFQLIKVFRNNHFDVIHCFYFKLMIYGTIAAKICKAKNIFGTNEGRGIIFSEDSGLIIKLLRPIIEQFIKIAWRLNDRLWFTNKNDLNYFVSKKIVNPEKVILTKNAINIEYFSLSSVSDNKLAKLRNEFEINNNDMVVVMIARMIWSKGIREFIEASEIIKSKYSYVKFLLVAPFEHGNPQAVPENYIKEKQKIGSFSWVGFREDVRDIYALADMVTLPSYYKEGGFPRTLLEPMGMAKPLITTNSPDCSETVENGKNGFLVPIKNSSALAEAIEKLILDPQKIKEFGQYSRMKVEKEFDERIVINRIIKELYKL